MEGGEDIKGHTVAGSHPSAPRPRRGHRSIHPKGEEGKVREGERDGRERTRKKEEHVPATGAILLLQSPDVDIDQPTHSNDAQEFPQGLDTNT